MIVMTDYVCMSSPSSGTTLISKTQENTSTDTQVANINENVWKTFVTYIRVYVCVYENKIFVNWSHAIKSSSNVVIPSIYNKKKTKITKKKNKKKQQKQKLVKKIPIKFNSKKKKINKKRFKSQQFPLDLFNSIRSFIHSFSHSFSHSLFFQFCLYSMAF